MLALQRSAINSVNQQKMLYNHRMGSKSFISARYAQRDSESGGEPNRIEFFKRTRYNKKKGWISNEAELRYNRMMELQSQSTEEGSKLLTQDRICDTVLGTRPRHVCGLGHGPKPVGSSSKTRALESSNGELREELEMQCELIKTMEAQQNELIQTIEAQQQSTQARQQELEDLVRRLLSSSAPSSP